RRRSRPGPMPAADRCVGAEPRAAPVRPAPPAARRRSARSSRTPAAPASRETGPAAARHRPAPGSPCRRRRPSPPPAGHRPDAPRWSTAAGVRHPSSRAGRPGAGRPDAPRLGDLRVSWDAVPLQQLTIVGRLDGARLGAATGAADGKGYQVQVGDVPLLDLFPDLPVPPEFVMIWRIVSVLLAALGALVLLSAQRRRNDPLLALGLGAIGVGSVASIIWLGGENAHALGGWLVVALVGVALSIWCLRRRSGGGGRY